MSCSKKLLAAVVYLFCLTTPFSTLAQPAVPLTDEVEQPVLPTGISEHDVELFGKLVYLWKTPDGADVLQYVGEFDLHMGQRRLNSDQAVIWMTHKTYRNRPYVTMEIVLWRNVRVIEPGGSVTSGPALFVTLNSFGKLRTEADDKTFESSEDTPLYEDALALRNSVLETEAGGPEADSPVAVHQPGQAKRHQPPAVRDKVYYRGAQLSAEQRGEETVITAVGDVYLAQGPPASAEFLEIRADAAVIFLGEPPKLGAPDMVPEDLLGSEDVKGAYLEGDIVLTRGERQIRAARLYYDFQNNRALILDAVMKAIAPGRDLPIYVRAEEVRQLSETQYSARRARITTSEFHTPHYSIGADRIELTDRQVPGELPGEAGAFRAGSFKMWHTTFNVESVPLTYWPYVQGDFRQSEATIRGIKVGYDDDFGVSVETEWHLFNILGLQTPEGFDGTLRLDYFSERGPGGGVDLDYEREDYFGLFRGYYVHDQGEDNLSRYREMEPDHENRGRLLLRHRHYLPDDWQLTLEASYISDDQFLEEWHEKEFDEGKEQETLLYLKKQKNNWAFTLLAQWRILNWLTQTERLPELGFRLIGQPLAEWATLYSENRLGFVRYRPDNRRWFDDWRFDNTASTGSVARADTRQEVEFPVLIGPVKIVPFGVIRGSAWEDRPNRGASLGRVFGSYGARASMYFSRVYDDLGSEVLDVTGIRHIIKPDVVAWLSHTNRDSHELTPFDPDVEQIDEVDGVMFGVRQRWQTKRGGPGNWRTVDLVTLDLETGFFNDSPGTYFTDGFVPFGRPENSISENFVRGDFMWRINDSTALLSDFNVDINDGQMEIFNLGFAVERSPRLSYYIGWRRIAELDSNLLGLGLNYKLDKKHTIAIREQFDLERGETLEFAVGYIRKFPRWYVGIVFDLDEIEDDMGISVSIWPEGLPQATLGPRRFTGLATSSGLKPN